MATCVHAHGGIARRIASAARSAMPMLLGVCTIHTLALHAPALALDQPISASSIKLKRSGSGKEVLVFKSADPAVLFPAPNSSDDPSQVGMTIDLFSTAGPASGRLTAPADSGSAHWRVKGGANAATGSYRFKYSGAPDAYSGVRTISFKQGKGIKVVARDVGLALASPSQAIGVRITTGTLRSCARFDSSTVQTDTAGRFTARNAVASSLADCFDGTVAGVPPLCGDGLQSPNEDCDGAMSCSDGPATFDCVAAGASNECTCCSNGSPIHLACCQPSVVVTMPPDFKMCIPSSCEPPFECDEGDVCQPDESCCSGLGRVCETAIYGPLLGCCPGLECELPVDLFGGSDIGLTCCIAGGQPCSANADCCSGDCDGTGHCATCIPDGGNCYDATPCCNGSCQANVCTAN